MNNRGKKVVSKNRLNPRQKVEVMVVEDHPTTRKLMSLWLELAGYRVRQAGDGNQAWSFAQDDCPPIVVTDWNMPEISGVELCRSIRESHSNDEVFIMIATSRENGHDMTEAMLAGANDFLSKPLLESEFMARIQNAENYLRQLQSTTELADSDPLTGLLNRRSFFEKGQAAIDEAKRKLQPLSCIVMDIDLFKQVNDEYGHAVGDQILGIVADSIREETRQSDLLCRLGGDEFSLILRGANEEMCLDLGERIRQKILQKTVEKSPVRITVTIGIAPIGSQICHVKELIEAADTVLLAAKNEGRDRIKSRCNLFEGESDSALLANRQIMDLFHSIQAFEIMRREVISLRGDLDIQTGHEMFLEAGQDCVCIVDHKNVLRGILTERDFLSAYANPSGAKGRTLNKIMNKNIAKFTVDSPIIKVWNSLQRTPMLRNIVVDRNESPIGFIQRRSFLQLLKDKNIPVGV